MSWECNTLELTNSYSGIYVVLKHAFSQPFIFGYFKTIIHFHHVKQFVIILSSELNDIGIDKALF